MTIWKPNLENEAEGHLPKYRALADAIQRDVYSGRLKPGERLPTHRELADLLGVNVSTVTRGYVEAERRGLIYGTVGRGTYISSDAQTASFMVSFEPHAPGMIELGLIEPFYDLDPDIHEGMRRLLRKRDLKSFLRYGDPRGMPAHRACGAQWVARYSHQVSADDVIVCSGAQHALTCCLSGLFQAGKRVGVDAMTYPGLKTLAAMLGIRLVPLPMDDQGVTPDGLDAACRRDTLAGIYLMPGVQNPTTATMSRERREELARLIRSHSLLLVEDDAYNLTVRGGLPPLASLVPERSAYIAGMSKAMAAGLRVAFVAAREPYRRALAEAVLNTTWMTPPLNVELACMWIAEGEADAAVFRKREEARWRNELARDVLQGLEFAGHDTGFFIWLSLPGQWTGTALSAAARRAGVNVFGAEKFAVGDSRVPARARVSLSGPWEREELRKGLIILRDLLEEARPA